MPPRPHPLLHLTLAACVLVAGACTVPPAEEAAPGAAAGGGETTAAAAAAHPDDPFAADFAGPIEAAHGAGAWYGHQAVAAAMTLEFGGSRLFDGSLTFTPDTGGVRLERPDGAVAVWDGETAWVAPPEAQFPPSARFNVLTWPYFFAAPFKLRDPGTRLADLGALPLDGTPHPAARLSFEGGVGDTPDDWYVLYRDPETDRLDAMAYVVTFGRTLEQAEAEPHAITYEEYVEVDGVQVPTVWRFWMWNDEEGVHGEPIGRVELSDVRFVAPASDAFVPPGDAARVELPPAGSEAANAGEETDRGAGDDEAAAGAQEPIE